MLSSRQSRLAASCMRCCRLRWIASKSDQLAAVKALREQSGAPISDVKAALVEADWKPGDRAHCLHGVLRSHLRHHSRTIPSPVPDAALVCLLQRKLWTC